MKVEAVKIKDIRDKEQKYVVLGEGKDKVVINVGEKTYTAVENLLKALQNTQTAKPLKNAS